MRLISDDEIHRRFKEGVTAYFRGDYRTAFREFKALAATLMSLMTEFPNTPTRAREGREGMIDR